MSRVSPVQYSPRRQSRWVLADYGGKICGKGEFWAWNETVNVWWRVRVVSRWEVESRFQILLFIRKLKWPNTSTTGWTLKKFSGDIFSAVQAQQRHPQIRRRIFSSCRRNKQNVAIMHDVTYWRKMQSCWAHRRHVPCLAFLRSTREHRKKTQQQHAH